MNWLLFIGVAVLMLTFRTSSNLATAYGIAVTGTLIVTTTLFIVVARAMWGWAVWKLVLVAVGFGGTEAAFFAANLTKVTHGGWLPLLIAAVVFSVMMTWQKGRTIVTARRVDMEGPLQPFVEAVQAKAGRAGSVLRVPGDGDLPAPHEGHGPVGAAGECGSQPRPARARRDRVRCNRRMCPMCRRATASASTTSSTPTTASCT